MDLGFIVSSTTHFKYIIPLIIEANKRGVSCTVFMKESSKYNDPYKYINTVNGFSSEFNFKIENLKSINGFDGVVFMIEGVGVDSVPRLNKKVSLVSGWDFFYLYDGYVNLVDKIIFPSKFIAEYENKTSDKNLYIGSPKYDIQLDKQKIIEKYNISSKKNALIIYPNLPALAARCGHKKIDYKKIYGYLRNMGYNIVVKARKKGAARGLDRGDQYIEDFSWFPHDTMELIEACDIVIISGSTTAKECIMLNKPFIDFPIALDPVVFSYLYNYGYCRVLEPSVEFDEFNKAISELLSSDYTKEFERSRKNHLFENDNISAKILDSVL